MNIDALMQSTGICQAPDLSMEARSILEDEARSFLDSGGVLCLSDLDQMCIMAQIMGVSETLVASAYAQVDGGEWLGNAVLEAKTEELVRKVGFS